MTYSTINVADMIAAINTITDISELDVIQAAAYERNQWLRQEKVEPTRLAAMYQATVDWPIGSRVRIKSVGYTTLDGKEGTIDHLVYPQRGYQNVRVAIWLGKKRMSPRYYVDQDGFVLVDTKHVEMIA